MFDQRIVDLKENKTISQEVVTQVISKALTDAIFREQLCANPGAALAGYELTEAERKGLSALDREEFDVYATDIEQHINQASLAFVNIMLRRSGLLPPQPNLQPEPPA